ncbi:MAG: asparagine synthase (glutamine-hydrolyzing) [Chloroflexi bacterium]|nr:asparagine synthase (glutamine-hydrolyzing) [Actinomycetota bacterium]MBA3739593.1 asparagine synthase (glutamine-hydrolyzing) [Chloroflexota bacterium]
MCGIAGVTGRDTALAKHDVEIMLSHLTHRGPDDEGVRTSRGAVLGARRLAIIDLIHGNQPMANEDGSVMAVQNGEIYNFRELRVELEARGHRFETDNDTEVIPHAYEEFGNAFPERLRGMFAIALWDESQRKLLLVRDRIGKKPLVYAEFRHGLAFASEIQALLSLGLDRTVDEIAIAQYLSLGYVPPPRSGFAHIKSLPPGTVLAMENGRLTDPAPYWRLSYQPKLAISDTEALERLRHEIDDAVRVRLMSDVPLGAFLSGGLDSSAVVAAMASNAIKVKTFSIGFADADFSELKYARLVAQRFGTDHHEFIVEPSAAEVLPMLVRHLGNPFADSSIVPTYYVAKVARERVTVALNGDGGDELFAGYDRYRVARYGAALDAIPKPILSMAGALTNLIPVANWMPRALRRVRRVGAIVPLEGDARYLALVANFSARDGAFGRRVESRANSLALFRQALAESYPNGPLERLLAIDSRTYLPGDLLVKMDIATMATSLEGRSPLLDQKLIEFVTHLPTRLKLRGGESKVLLRRLMKGVLPERVINRPKMGFGVPVGRWMRGPMRTLVEDTLLAMPDRSIVDRDFVHRLAREHLSGRLDHTARLWSLLMLELWFIHVVGGGPGPAGSQDTYRVTTTPERSTG